ncbi:hypothetical protein E2C01_023460 [Portunus trituberculatus]|uniref:Uncharacterized protein n=1 Tax=Portunus trituberculatus TaxID=210409 RepID=A0A5B7E804_PORTR|nr:hypothetical protein [Portunus trituberculatus]
MSTPATTPCPALTHTRPKVSVNRSQGRTQYFAGNSKKAVLMGGKAAPPQPPPPPASPTAILNLYITHIPIHKGLSTQQNDREE